MSDRGAATERRLLQVAVALACLVPLLAGAAGAIHGPSMIHGVVRPVPADLDSHFRYLSGLLLAIGVALAACVPGIERKTARFRLLGLLVIAGGLARLLGLVLTGTPGVPHFLALAMELVVVPLLILWQARVAKAEARRE